MLAGFYLLAVNNQFRASFLVSGGSWQFGHCLACGRIFLTSALLSRVLPVYVAIQTATGTRTPVTLTWDPPCSIVTLS